VGKNSVLVGSGPGVGVSTRQSGVEVTVGPSVSQVQVELKLQSQRPSRPSFRHGLKLHMVQANPSSGHGTSGRGVAKLHRGNVGVTVAVGVEVGVATGHPFRAASTAARISSTVVSPSPLLSPGQVTGISESGSCLQVPVETSQVAGMGHPEKMEPLR
jgi:hypothetical protein